MKKILFLLIAFFTILIGHTQSGRIHIEEDNKKYELKDFEGAMLDYTKAIELDPNNSINYKYRGDMMFELKNFKEALADYTKAVELDPNYAFSYTNRGDTKFELQDYQSAILDYTKAIAINPNDKYLF
jgi:tetratricopeptide (TPR) repeat protein